MKFDLESFLWIWITLAVFRRIGKVSVVKEKCLEMSFSSIFKTLLGILYGPVELLISREKRINLITSLLVGERKNKSRFSFVR